MQSRSEAAPKSHSYEAVRQDPVYGVAMHLTGALSNPEVRVEVARLAALRKRLLRGNAQDHRPARSLRPRNGAVHAAVISVLTKSAEPMSVGDVHAAVERLLSISVSRDWVNACLSASSKGRKAQLERVGYGWYRALA
jgi:hypothetical protein